MTKPWESLPWFQSYERAVLEEDLSKLPDRIHAAEAAIQARTVEVDPRDILEKGALRDALKVLQLMLEHESLRKKQL
jgi:hypothetical protein